MKKLILIFPFLLFQTACSNVSWKALLDSKLSQWDTYLSYKHSAQYSGAIPKDESGNPIPPIGLNKGNEEHKVFTIIQENNKPVLRVSGEIYGAITSKEIYQNYHLKLKVRWGDKKWSPRKDKLMDSGILYHAIGKHGSDYFRSWMLSQEFQIMQGHMGDYWKQATSAIDIRAYPPEYIMNPIADESQPFIKVGQNESVQGFVLRNENYEKAHGQWNTLELICYNGKSIHSVNGHIVMVLRNSRYVDNDVSIPLLKGKIQIQSEAAEVFYKDIQIKDLDKLPKKYSHLF